MPATFFVNESTAPPGDLPLVLQHPIPTKVYTTAAVSCVVEKGVGVDVDGGVDVVVDVDVDVDVMLLKFDVDVLVGNSWGENEDVLVGWHISHICGHATRSAVFKIKSSVSVQSGFNCGKQNVASFSMQSTSVDVVVLVLVVLVEEVVVPHKPHILGQEDCRPELNPSSSF